MTSFKKGITIKASKENVWKTLSNLGGVHKYHPGVINSYYSTDKKEGVGAAGICELAPMGKVLETATSWEKGKKLSLRIKPLEKTPPFKGFDATITLIEEKVGEVKLEFDISYGMKLGLIGIILNKMVVESQLHKGIQGVMDGLKVHLEQGVEIKDAKDLAKYKQVA
ncbi:MAG: carbon monoxide dehydrogenase subunit G [Glaciecola sp.]|jgi:carbon monoxide dehydrogenase subunit G